MCVLVDIWMETNKHLLFIYFAGHRNLVSHKIVGKKVTGKKVTEKK